MRGVCWRELGDGEAYVGSGVPMGGVCWKWGVDARRMLEGCRCEAYVGSGVAMGGVCWKWGDGRRMLEVEGRWEAMSRWRMRGVCWKWGADRMLKCGEAYVDARWRGDGRRM